MNGLRPELLELNGFVSAAATYIMSLKTDIR
jgi:hypothetical protein